MKSAVPRYLFALTLATGALALVLLLFSAPLPAQGATVTLDGQIDAAYGPPIASDSTTDGNGNDNMDLGELYIAEDTDYFYFAFTVDANIGAVNWGKYVIYVDTNGTPSSGATSDA